MKSTGKTYSYVTQKVFTVLKSYFSFIKIQLYNYYLFLVKNKN